MTCDNLLCKHQNCCAFPLQCVLNKPATVADGSTKTFIHCSDCRADTKLRCPVIGCYYDANKLLRPRERSALSDKALVEKIERGNVLLAEDLNELIERFKAYSKLE